jgi:hypothetical protein
MHSFEGLEASLLYCPVCRQATPVRKRLLLIVPEGEKFDYVCTRCGALCGDKIERPGPASRPAKPRHDPALWPPRS